MSAKKLHPKTERSLVIIKPDGVQRTLVGEVMKRYERVGLKLVGMKLVVPDKERVIKHYSVDPEWKRKVGEKNIKTYIEQGVKPPTDDPLKMGDKVIDRLALYMTSGPVVLMVWQGAHAVPIIRKITGGTEPRTSDVGTIRGDFMLDSYEMADLDERAIRNIIHASSSVDEAEKEIAIWFKENEIVKYRLVQEQILYDVNLDGIFE